MDGYPRELHQHLVSRKGIFVIAIVEMNLDTVGPMDIAKGRFRDPPRVPQVRNKVFYTAVSVLLTKLCIQPINRLS